MNKPTKAQLALLRWMVSREEGTDGSLMVRMRGDGEWRGGMLIDYYEQRWLTERTGVPLIGPTHRFTAGSPKVHAWRRAGGTALKNLAERGYAEMVGFSIGVPIYMLTDEGRRIGAADDA